MTEKLFLDDPRLRSASGTVLASGPEGIVLDRTVFYARSGGQPGDIGVLRWDGGETAIADTVKGEGETILHLPAPGAALPPVGAAVEGEIDWDRRYRLMRMHTAMHLLCSLIKGAAVTGGSVGAERSRLDFDLPNPPPKEEIEAGLNALVEADLLEYARTNKCEELVVALALMCSVSVDIVDRLMDLDRPDAMLIACRAAGLEWSTTREIIALQARDQEISEAGFRRARENFNNLTKSSADRILHFWQTRQPVVNHQVTS